MKACCIGRTFKAHRTAYENEGVLVGCFAAEAVCRCLEPNAR